MRNLVLALLLPENFVSYEYVNRDRKKEKGGPTYISETTSPKLISLHKNGFRRVYMWAWKLWWWKYFMALNRLRPILFCSTCIFPTGLGLLAFRLLAECSSQLSNGSHAKSSFLRNRADLIKGRISLTDLTVNARWVILKALKDAVRHWIILQGTMSFSRAEGQHTWPFFFFGAVLFCQVMHRSKMPWAM